LTRKRLRLCAHAVVVGALLAGLVLTVPAKAGEMTLAECVSTALASNRGIAEAREGLAQARSGITEARSGFLPNLTLSGSYNFMEKTQSVSLPTASGGTQEMELDFTRDYGMEVALSQPLYTGGRLVSSYRISKLARDIADADVARLEADVTLSVVEAFYSYLLARESVKVAEEATKTAEEFLRVVEARYKAGEASKFEVMRAEVEVSNLKPALISAKHGVSLAELGLKNLMGLGLDQPTGFTGEFGSGVFRIDPAEAERAGLERRPELAMLRCQSGIANQSLSLAKAGRFPTLAITTAYDMLGNDLSLDEDKWETTYNGYLVLSLPLFDGLKTKSQIARSKSEVRQAGIALADAEEGVKLGIRSSVLELDAAVERLRSQEKNVEMAEEGLKIANDRYVQGVATNLEVMDAQLALTQARNYRLQALYDINLATARLKRAMGVLLEDY
jgi:outer membrane protein